MPSVLATYLIGLLATASLLMAWFFTTGPIHVFHIARRLGYRKDDSWFWGTISPEWECTWLDLETLLNDPSRKFPEWLATLLQCRYCLSFHVSFWVAFICALLEGHGFLFVMAATFSWPVLANIILLLFNTNNKEQ